MRCYYNGTGFTVSFNENDADNFAANWPASSVEGSGSFAFDSNGDVVDRTGSALGPTCEGEDWEAFAADCRSYGMPRYEKRRAAEDKRGKLFSRALRVILGETDGKVC